MPRPRSEIPWCDVEPNGVYHAYWYSPAKRRTEKLSLRTRDPKEAQSHFAAFLMEGKEVYAPEKAQNGITVWKALDDYYVEHVKVECVDVRRQEDAIRPLKEFFKDMLLKDVDIPRTRKYAEARRTGQVGGKKYWKNVQIQNSTIRRELNALRAAASHALKWKRINMAEMPSVELPKVDHKEAPWLTKAELVRLMNAADGELKAFIVLAYYSAARRNSIERLTRAQIDLPHRRINLMLPGERRTKKRKPIVPIYDEMLPTVETLLAESANDFLFGRVPDFYRPFNDLCRRIGLEGKAHPHILRHSRATHMLQDGIDLWSVAKLLGDTTTTVERVYGHHSPDYLRVGSSSDTGEDSQKRAA